MLKGDKENGHLEGPCTPAMHVVCLLTIGSGGKGSTSESSEVIALDILICS